jgi:hypothetical protein
MDRMRQPSLHGRIYGESCAPTPDADFSHDGWISGVIRFLVAAGPSPVYVPVCPECRSVLRRVTQAVIHQQDNRQQQQGAGLVHGGQWRRHV